MTPTPQDAEAVAQAREALVRVLQAAHISCEPSTFYDLAETLGVTFPPTEHQIADALFAAVRVEGARDALTRFVKERREGTASDDQWDMLCDLERFRDREYPAPAERERYTEGIVLKPTEREATPPQAAPEPLYLVVEYQGPLGDWRGDAYRTRVRLTPEICRRIVAMAGVPVPEEGGR